MVDWLTLVGLAVASRAVWSPARSYGLVVCLAWSARRWLGGSCGGLLADGYWRWWQGDETVCLGGFRGVVDYLKMDAFQQGKWNQFRLVAKLGWHLRWALSVGGWMDHDLQS